MNLLVEPDGTDRLVTIRHLDWDLSWRLQFPEVIMSTAGSIMAWPLNCKPEWEQLDNGAWEYSWRPSSDYIESVRSLEIVDTNGIPQHRRFVRGLELRAEIRPGNDSLDLTISLVNDSEEPVTDVYCDGGCLQAKNDAFTGADEVGRSHVMVDGVMCSMATLPRSVDIRCMYCHTQELYDGKDEWFWGRSTTSIDSPAIVGAVSSDRTKAITFGYENSNSCLANSDEHHCLHSRPWFGKINSGERISHKGYILFGTDMQELADKLKVKLAANQAS